MSTGIATHSWLKILAATITANDGVVWTKVGIIPDALALIVMNDLDQPVQVRFQLTQGAAAPANGDSPDYEFAAGEPAFVNYMAIGHMLGSSDVYIRRGASGPTTGSLRLTLVKRAPARFKGIGT